MPNLTNPSPPTLPSTCIFSVLYLVKVTHCNAPCTDIVIFVPFQAAVCLPTKWWYSNWQTDHQGSAVQHYWLWQCPVSHCCWPPPWYCRAHWRECLSLWMLHIQPPYLPTGQELGKYFIKSFFMIGACAHTCTSSWFSTCFTWTVETTGRLECSKVTSPILKGMV